MRTDPRSQGSDSPFDPGLQLERTALAWRRTALAWRRTALTCCAGALLAMRVLPDRLGPWALLCAAVLAAASAITMIAAHRRYRAHHRTLTEPDAQDRPPTGGALPGAIAALTALLGVLALAAIL